MGESERPLTIISEENRLRGVPRHGSSEPRGRSRTELVAVGLPRHGQAEEECTITASVSVAALPSLTPHHRCSREHHAASEPGSQTAMDAMSPSASSEHSLGSDNMSATTEEHTSFSREVITFSLFGRIHPKCSKSDSLVRHIKFFVP